MAEAVLAVGPPDHGGHRRPAQAAATAARGHRHRRGPGRRAAGDRPGGRAARRCGPSCGLGSNLGDRVAHLRRAVDQLRAGSRVPVTAVSRVYETEPVGGPEDQGPFLNLVVELAVARRPTPTGCSRSAAASRPPPAGCGPSGGARGPSTPTCSGSTGMALDDPELTVPHPRWRERRFVLAPWRELAPDLVDEDDLADRWWRGARRGYTVRQYSDSLTRTAPSGGRNVQRGLVTTFRTVGPGRAGRSLMAALDAVGGFRSVGALGRRDPPRHAAGAGRPAVHRHAGRRRGRVAAQVRSGGRPPPCPPVRLARASTSSTHPRRGSLHPLVPLPTPAIGAERLRSGVTFAVAGDPVTRRLAEALGGSRRRGRRRRPRRLPRRRRRSPPTTWWP